MAFSFKNLFGGKKQPIRNKNNKKGRRRQKSTELQMMELEKRLVPASTTLNAISNQYVLENGGAQSVGLTGVGINPAPTTISVALNNSMTSSETAGIVPVVGADWNTFSQSNLTTAANLKNSVGSSSGVTLLFKATSQGQGTLGTETGSAGNNALMSTGLEMYTGDNIQLELQGVTSSLFPYGYDVYVYYAHYSTASTYSVGSFAQSYSSADYTTTVGSPTEGSLTSAQTIAFNDSTTPAFNGTFTNAPTGNGDYVEFSNSAPASSTTVLSAYVTGGPTFSISLLTGFQIVGLTPTLSVAVTGDSNPSLFSTTPSVTYTSPNATGTLTYTPGSNATGTANVTVVASGSGLTSTTQTFSVNVSAGQTTTTSLTDNSSSPSAFGAGVSYTINTSNVPNGSTVYLEDVDNANAVVGSVSISSNTGSTSIASLSLGTHAIEAVYTGSASVGGYYAASNSSSVNQVVENPTTLNAIANQYAVENAGAQTVGLTGIGINPSPPTVSVVLNNAMTSTQTAGIVPVVGADWNIFNSNNLTTATNLKNSSGSASGITLLYKATSNGQGTLSPESGSAGNQALMSTGLEMYTGDNIQLELQGLSSSMFPYGYDVYVYYAHYSTSNTYSVGSFAQSYSSADYTTTVGSPTEGSLTSAQTIAFNDSTTPAFNGTFTNAPTGNGDYVEFTNSAPSSSTTVLSAYVTGGPSFAISLLTGFQIVGILPTETVAVTGDSNPSLFSSVPSVSYTSPNATGSIAYTPATNATGSANVTVVASVANYVSTTQTFSITVSSPAATTTSLTDNSSSPSTYGVGVSYTVNTSNVPNGQTVLLEDTDNANAVVGSVTISGNTGSTTISNLTVGNHAIEAVYAGTAGPPSAFAASNSSAVTQVVNLIPTSTSLTDNGPTSSSYNQTVSFTVNTTGMPNGSTVYLEDTTNANAIVGSVVISSNTGSTTIANISPGTHAIEAVYTSVSPYAGSNSSTVNQIVAAVGSTTLNSIATQYALENAGAQSVGLTGIGYSPSSPGTTVSVETSNSGKPPYITSTETAGIAPVLGADWNEFRTGSMTATSLINSSGSASGITLAFKATEDSEGPGLGASGGTAGNDALMGGYANPVNSGGQAQFELNGLTSALFPYGYDVYIYYTRTGQSGSGAFVQSYSSTDYTTTGGSPAESTLTNPQTIAFNDSAAVAFNGTFTNAPTSNGNYVEFVDPAPTSSTTVLSVYVNSQTGSQWPLLIQGFQVVGVTPTVNLAVTNDSNPSLFSVLPSVTYTSPNATGTLAYTPAPGQTGTANITVTASSSGNTPATQTFTINVAAGSPTTTSLTDNGPNPSATSSGVSYTVNTSGVPNGSTVYLEDTSNANAVVGSVSISSNTGSTTISTLTTAGTHAIEAVYAGSAGATSYAASNSSAVNQVVENPTTLSAIANQYALENAGAQTVGLTGIGINPSPPTVSIAFSTSITSTETAGIVPVVGADWNEFSASSVSTATSLKNASGSASGITLLFRSPGTVGTLGSTGGTAGNVALMGQSGDEMYPGDNDQYELQGLTSTMFPYGYDVYVYYAHYSNSTTYGVGSFAQSYSSADYTTTEGSPAEGSLTSAQTIAFNDSATPAFNGTFTNAPTSGGNYVEFTNSAPSSSTTVLSGYVTGGGTAYQIVPITGIQIVGILPTETVAITGDSNPSLFSSTPSVTYTSGNSTGSISYTPATNATGSANITVVASVTNYISTTQTFSITVSSPAATTTSLTDNSSSPSAYGAGVSYTVNTSNVPNGQTVLLEDTDNANAVVGSVTISGNTGSTTISNLVPGTHAIEAVYAGTAGPPSAFAASNSSALTQVVNLIPTSTTLTDNGPSTSSYNSRVSFTVNTTGVPNGSTVYLEDTTNANAVVGSVVISSNTGSTTINTITAGTHAIEAVYPGTATYALSNSATVNQTVTAVGTTTLSSIATQYALENGGAQSVGLTGIGYSPSSPGTTVSVETSNSGKPPYITSTETAGIAPVLGADWNEFRTGSMTATSLINSSGSASGITLAFKATEDSEGPGLGASGGTAGNDALMGGYANPVNSGGQAQFELNGLTSALFPYGYDVYIYYTRTGQSGSGAFVQSYSSTDYTTTGGSPAESTLTNPQTIAFNDSAAVAFNGTFTDAPTSNGNYVEFVDPAPTSSTTVLSVYVNSQTGSQWPLLIQGFQVVGVSPTVNLAVTGDSNPTLFSSAPSVTYTSPNSTGTLTYTPAPGQTGTANITVTAGSSGNTPATQTFTVNVVAGNATTTSLTDNGPTPSPTGSAVSFTVNTSGVPNGSTVYLEDLDNSNAVVGSVTISGNTGSTSISSLSFGPHSIEAVYLGSAGVTSYAASNSSAISQSVENPTTIASIPTQYVDENSGSTTVNLTGIGVSPPPTTVSVSFNNSITSSETAGIAPVVGADWNEFSQGSLSTATSLKNSNGSASGITLLFKSTGNGPGTLSPESGNPGDDALMSTGLEMYTGDNIQMELSGMTSSLFPFGYDVYVYYAHYSNSTTYSVGSFAQSYSSADYTSTVGSPAESSLTSAQTVAFNDSTTPAFNGTYTNAPTGNGDYVEFTNSSPTSSTTVLSAYVTGGPQYAISDLTGIQIVAIAPAETVTVTGNSNSSLFSEQPSISYTSPNATGTLSFTPFIFATGTANITVTASVSGYISTSQTFTVDVVAPTTTGVNLTDNGSGTSTVGSAVSFTVNSTSVPDGSTVFLEDADNSNAVVGSITISGSTGSTTISNLTYGTHDIFAVYNGAAGVPAYAASSSSGVLQVVNLNLTTTTLTDNGPSTSTYGSGVSFTVNTTGVPSGSTIYLENADNSDAVVGSVTLSGTTGSTTVSTLSAGTFDITAVYGGNSAYAASNSSTVHQVVNPLALTTTGLAAANKAYDGTTTATVGPVSQIVSLHFYANSGTLGTGYTDALASTDTAGVDSVANWNNVGTGATGSASNLTNSAGSATSVGVSWAAGAIDDQFVYGAGQDALPTAGTKGNQELMSSTLESQPQYTHVELTNLPASYSVYVYLEEPATFWGAIGTIYAGDSTEFTTNTSTGLPGGSDSPVAQAGFQVFQGLPPSGTYNGTFTQTTSQTVAGNYVLLQNLNLSTLALTVAVSSSNGQSFAGTGIAGIQIVSSPGLSGVLTRDLGNVSLVTSGATGTFASPNAGTGISVSVSGLTLTGSAASNYTLTQPTLSANITQATSSLTLTDNGPNPATSGQSVSFTVNSTGIPNGDSNDIVDLEDADASNAVVGSVTISGGTGSTTISNLSVGSHSIFAAYNGDSNVASSQSSAVAQTVSASLAPTSTALTDNGPNASQYSEGVSFTVNTTGVPDGSTVDLEDTSNSNAVVGSVTITSNTGSTTISSLSVGTHAIEAVYAGDVSHTYSDSSTVTQVVSNDSTTTTLSALSPITYGSEVTFTATVSAAYGTPSVGTVTFEDNGVALAGSSTVNVSGGTATFETTSYLTAGTHPITAVYSGGTDYQNSSTASASSQVVNQLALTVSGITVNNKVYDGTTSATIATPTVVSLAFNTLGADTSNVSPYYSNELGSGDVAGVDALSNWNNVPGNSSGASIGSVSNLLNSSGAATNVGVSYSAGYGLNGDSYNSAYQNPYPSGGTQGNQELMMSGLVTYNNDYSHIELTNLPANYNVYVYLSESYGYWGGIGTIYAGDSTEYTTSSSTEFAGGSDSPVASAGFKVVPTFNGTFTPTNSSTTGNYVEFTNLSLSTLVLTQIITAGDGYTFPGASITGIQIVGGGGLSGVLSQDLANVSLVTSGESAVFTSPNAGTNVPVQISGLTLTGSAASNYTLTQPTTTANITEATSSLALTDNGPSPSNTGSGVSFTVNSTGVPNGETVDLEDADASNAVVGSVTISGNTGSTTISSLSVGTHSIFAAYTSDGNVASSQSSAVSQTVSESLAPTTTTLTDNGPSPSQYNEGVSYTVNTTGVPDGATVYLEDTDNSNAVVGSVTISGGTGSTTVSNLSFGTHAIEAVYAGDGSHANSDSSTVTQVVGADSTTTTLNALSAITYGNEVTFTATVSGAYGTPSVGTVTFEDNGVALAGSSTVNVSGGTATFETTTYLTAGTHPITAVYSGGTDYQSSSTSSATNQVVNQLALTVSGLVASNKVYDGTTNATVSAAPTVISAHFTPENSGNESGGYPDTLGSSDIAGVVTASNWNNVGTGVSGTATNLVNSGGTATTTSIQWAAGSGMDDQYNYGAGNDDRQPSGGTQGNQELMGSGIASLGTSEYTHVELTNLPASYNVYVYIQEPAYFWGTIGNLYAGDSTEFTTNTSTEFPGGDDAPVASTGIKILNSAFSGSFTQTTSQSVSGDYVEFTGLSLSTLVLTLQATSSNGESFAGASIAGIQIVAGPGLSGVLSQDVGNVSLVTSGVTGTFASPNAGTGITVQVAGLTLTGSAASNYTLTQPTTTANITEATSSLALTDNGPSPSNTGSGVSFTVNSTGVPNGETVDLEDADASNAVVGSVTISGNTGSTTISSLSAGTHSIFAAYTSDGNFASSQSSAVSQVVNSSETSTTTSLTDNGPNASYSGQAVSYTVNTTGVPNGATVYLDDANQEDAQVGSVVITSGTGSTTISSLSVGTHGIFASYAGDETHSSSSSGQIAQVVNSVTTTTTSLTDNGPSPSIVGTGVSYTVSTTGVPNGSTVYLEDADHSNAVVGSVVVSGGTGSTTVSNLSIGSHSIFAVYTGATGYTASQSTPALAQTVSPIAVTSVAVNGDFIAISDLSEAGQTVTVTSDGINGFTAGNKVVIAGETGTAAGYNGTWTILSASGDTFTYTNSATGLPTLTFNANGYAISTNTSSSLRGSQRSMVDSVVYTFNAPVNLTSNAVTMALKGGITVTGPNTMATGVANVNWTSLSGGKIWVMTFSSASGNTVTGHSIADGVYTLSLNSADVTAVAGGSTMTTTRATDTFYRLYADTNGQQRVSNADLLAFNNCYAQEAPSASYLAALDYNADGRVNNTDLLAFNNHYSAHWTGFTSTI